MENETKKYRVLIASYLEPEHIQRICEVDERFDIIFKPELLSPPRYPADHYNTGTRTPEQEITWRALLAEADVLFDFDYSNLKELPYLAPRLRWIQASSAGIGQLVKRNQYAERMPDTVFTTASGVHARPLAEFVIMAMLAHYKGLTRMIRRQLEHQWERYAGTDLAGRTLAIIGLGRIGSEVARFARALGMTVIGTDVAPAGQAVDHFYPFEDFRNMLPIADVLTLCVPHTPQTEKLIGANELALLKPDAYFINISRGAVVDEPALIDALRSGKLCGAALDVFENEPLPENSPLWDFPNVLISPHSASTSDRENERLTDIFCENLRRFLDGSPLRNVLNPKLLY